MHEPGFDVVVVLGADAPAGPGHRQRHQRKAELAARHVTQLAGAVHQFVHGIAEERGKQQVGDRTQATGGGARRRAGDDAFGQRGIADTQGAELGDEFMAFGGNTFAKGNNCVIAAHFLGQREADGIVQVQCRHGDLRRRRRG